MDRRTIQKDFSFCYPFANRLLSVCYAFSIQSFCYPFAIRLPSVCHPFAIRLLSVCYPYFNPILLIFLCYHSFIDPFHLFRLEKNDKNVFFAVTQNTLRLLGISCVSTSLLPISFMGDIKKGCYWELRTTKPKTPVVAVQLPLFVGGNFLLRKP